MRSRTLMFLCSTLLAVAPAAAQERMYKCVDARGKVYYTQVPPTECLGRETEELNNSGTVIKRNAAPLTAAQRAQIEAEREAERKRKIDDDARKKEEQRRSTALLNTYSSERDIEEARARALKDNEIATAETEKRLQGAVKRQKELESEKDGLSKPLPKKLVEDLQNIEIELKTQQESLDARRKQDAIINAKYDEDKRRYHELTSGKPAPTAARK